MELSGRLAKVPLIGAGDVIENNKDCAERQSLVTLWLKRKLRSAFNCDSFCSYQVGVTVVRIHL